MKKKGKREGARRKEGEFPFSLALDGDRAHIIAELPGVSEEKIRLDLEKGTLVVSATDGECHYRMGIALPWESRVAMKRFRRGVLELTLEKVDR
jgi:HSP20 family molecular chaperone IbpA